MFSDPREMSASECDGAVEEFVIASQVIETAGFDGIQIHAAHGYLLSSFLSSNINLRTDQYNATDAKILFDVIRAVRNATGPSFIVGLKINSADFQRGGLTEEQSFNIIRQLDELKLLDFIEISGGNYEEAAMMGVEAMRRSDRTVAREAYFAEFSRKVKGAVATPIMLTGGMRSGRGKWALPACQSAVLVNVDRSFLLTACRDGGSAGVWSL